MKKIQINPIIMLVFIITILIFSADNFWGKKQLEEKVVDLENEIKRVQSTNESLEAKLTNLQVDSVKKVAESQKINNMVKQVDQEVYKANSNGLQDNKAIELSIRDLQVEAKKYEGKKVKVGPLKIFSNDIYRPSFITRPTSGKNYFDVDFDVSIEIFYDRMKNVSEWRNLKSTGYPNINVTGTFYLYNNSTKGFIQAEEITMLGKTYP